MEKYRGGIQTYTVDKNGTYDFVIYYRNTSENHTNNATPDDAQKEDKPLASPGDAEEDMPQASGSNADEDSSDTDEDMLWEDEIPLIMDLDMPENMPEDIPLASTSDADEEIHSMTVSYEVTDLVPFTYEFTMESVAKEDADTTEQEETGRAAVRLTVTPVEEDAVIYGIILPDGTRTDGTEALFVVEENGPVSFEVLYDINADGKESAQPKPVGLAAILPFMEEAKPQSKTLTYEVNLLAKEGALSAELLIANELTDEGTWDYLHADTPVKQQIQTKLKIWKTESEAATRTIRVESLDTDLYTLGSAFTDIGNTPYIKDVGTEDDAVTYTIDNTQAETEDEVSSLDIIFNPVSDLWASVREKWMDDPDFDTLRFQITETIDGIETFQIVTLTLKKDYPLDVIDMESTGVSYPQGYLEKNGETVLLTNGSLKLFPSATKTGEPRIYASDDISQTGDKPKEEYLRILLKKDAHMPIRNLKVTLPYPDHFGTGKGIEPQPLPEVVVEAECNEELTTNIILDGKGRLCRQVRAYPILSGYPVGTTLAGKADPNRVNTTAVFLGNPAVGLEEFDYHILLDLNRILRTGESYFDLKREEPYVADKPIAITYEQLQQTEDGSGYAWMPVTIDLGNLQVTVPDLSFTEIKKLEAGQVEMPANGTIQVPVINQASDAEFKDSQRARSYRNGTLTIDVPQEMDVTKLDISGMPEGTDIQYFIGDTEVSEDQIPSANGQVTKIQVALPDTVSGIGEAVLNLLFTASVTAKTTLNLTFTGKEAEGTNVYTDSLSVEIDPNALYMGIAGMFGVVRTTPYFANDNTGISFAGGARPTVGLQFSGKGETRVYEKLVVELDNTRGNLGEEEIAPIALVNPQSLEWNPTGVTVKVQEGGSIKAKYTTVDNSAEQEVDLTKVRPGSAFMKGLLDADDTLTSFKLCFNKVSFSSGEKDVKAVLLYMYPKTLRSVQDIDGRTKPVQEGEDRYTLAWKVSDGSGKEIPGYEYAFDYLRTAELDLARTRMNDMNKPDQKAPVVISPGTISVGETNPDPIDIYLPYWYSIPGFNNHTMSYDLPYPEGSKVYLPLADSYLYAGGVEGVSEKTVAGQRYLVWDLTDKTYEARLDFYVQVESLQLPENSIRCVGKADKYIFDHEKTGYIDYGPLMALSEEEAPYFKYTDTEDKNNQGLLVEDSLGLTEDSGCDYEGPRLLPFWDLGGETSTAGSDKNMLFVTGGVEGGGNRFTPEESGQLSARIDIVMGASGSTNYDLLIELPREGETFNKQEIPDGNTNAASLYLRDVDGNSVTVETTSEGVSDPVITYLQEDQTTSADTPEETRFVKVSFQTMPAKALVSVNLSLEMPEEAVYDLADGAKIYLSAVSTYDGGSNEGNPLGSYEFAWNSVSGMVFEENSAKAPDGVYGTEDTLVKTAPELQYRLAGQTEADWKSTEDSSSLWNLTFDSNTGIYEVTVKPSKTSYEVKAVPPAGKVLTLVGEGKNGNAFPREADAFLTFTADENGLAWKDTASNRTFEEVNIGYYKDAKADVTMNPTSLKAVVDKAQTVTFTPSGGSRITSVVFAENSYAKAEKKSGEAQADTPWIYELTGVKSTNEPQKIMVTVEDPFGGTPVTKNFTYTVPRTAFVTFDRGTGEWVDKAFGDEQKVEVEFAEYGAPLAAGKVPEVTPPEHYTFEGWTLDGQPADLTKTEMKEGMVFTASFAPITHTVTFTAAGDNGTIQPSSVMVNEGTAFGAGNIPSVTPNPGYVHTGWTKAEHPDVRINLAKQVILKDAAYVAEMMSDAEADAENGYALIGNSFILEDAAEAQAMDTADKVAQAAGAEAWVVNTGVSETIRISEDDLDKITSTEAAGGIYTITLLAGPEGKSVSRKIQVVVKGSQVAVGGLGTGGSITDETVALHAEPFTKADYAVKLSPTDAVDAAKAYALYVKTGADANDLIQVNEGELDAINGIGAEGGKKSLTFSAKDGSVKVEITVSDKKVLVIFHADDPENPAYTGTLSESNGFQGNVSSNGKTATLEVIYDTAVGNMPVAEVPDGAAYLFKEWVIQAETGYVPYTVQKITAPTELHARYTADTNKDGIADEKQIQFKYQVSEADLFVGHGLEQNGADVTGPVTEWVTLNDQKQASPKVLLTGKPADHYQFDGWTYAGQTGPDPVAPEALKQIAFDRPESGVITFTANFSRSEYVVSFTVEGDKGTVDPAEMVVPVGGKLTALPAVTPASEAYVHTGWKKAGSEALVNPLADEITEDTTYTAVFSPAADVAVENGYALTGNSFILENAAEAQAMDTAEKVAKAAGAEAWVVKTGASEKVSISEADLKKITSTKATGGIYTITLLAGPEGKGVSREIRVVVKGSQVDVSGLGNDGSITDDTVALYAEPFSKAYNEPDLSSDNAVARSKASACYVKAGKEDAVAVTVDRTQLKEINGIGAEGGTRNLAFSANGAKVTVAVTVATVKVRVTFDANDPLNPKWTGTLSADKNFQGEIAENQETATLDIILGSSLNADQMPLAKESEDALYLFKKWVVQKDDGYVPFEMGTSISADTTIYAHYTADSNNDGTADEKQIQFVYEVSSEDAVLGHGLQETGQSETKQTVEEWVNVDDKNEAAPAVKVTGVPTNTHYEFVGWIYDGQTTPVTAEELQSTAFERPVSGKITFTANFRKKEYTVTFAAENGKGTVSPETAEVEAEKTLGQVLTGGMPEVTPVDGYVFVGWKNQNGSRVDLAKEQITAPVTYTAELMEKDQATLEHGLVLTGTGAQLNQKDLEAENLESLVVNKAGAEAWNMTTGEELTVSISNGDLEQLASAKEKGGIYTITLQAGPEEGGVSREILLVVAGSQTAVAGLADDGSVTEDTVALHAEPFAKAYSEEDLTAETAKEKAYAEAYAVKTGTRLEKQEIQVNADDLKAVNAIQAEGGSQNVRFSVKDAEVTVTVTVARETATVTFTADRGTLSFTSKDVVLETRLGKENIPAVTPETGYEHAGWARADEPDTLINLAEEVITEAVTYVAVMKKSEDENTGHGSGSSSMSSTSSMGKWLNTGWSFVKAGGQKAAGEWLAIDGKIYRFTANGFMDTTYQGLQFAADGSLVNPADAKTLPAVAAGTWVKDGWRYELANGGYLKNGWYYLSYQGRFSWYYFDADGWMLDGWLDNGGNRYYLHTAHDYTRGRMYEGWHQIGGKWYYFYTKDDKGITGALVRNGKTPDGYTVDENGVWDGRGSASTAYVRK